VSVDYELYKISHLISFTAYIRVSVRLGPTHQAPHQLFVFGAKHLMFPLRVLSGSRDPVERRMFVVVIVRIRHYKHLSLLFQ
jgi:hypothetical protein